MMVVLIRVLGAFPSVRMLLLLKMAGRFQLVSLPLLRTWRVVNVVEALLMHTVVILIVPPGIILPVKLNVKLKDYVCARKQSYQAGQLMA